MCTASGILAMQKRKIILLFLYLLVARFLCEQKPDQEEPMQEKSEAGVAY